MKRLPLFAVLVGLLAVSLGPPLDAQTRVRLRKWFTTDAAPNQAPSAAITLTTGFFINETWTVSTTGTNDIDGAIASGTLDWGDGTTVPITGVPAATYSHTYTVATTRTITFSITDNGSPALSDQATIDVTVREVPIEGDGNAYFDFWSADSTNVFHYAMRTQTEVIARTQNTQGVGEIWRYEWPGALAANCHGGSCDDTHPVSPNGARLRMPPKGWRRDRASYPSGSFLYPEYAPHASSTFGNEGESNAGRLRFPIGASVAAGWNSVTIVFDFYWDETYHTMRGGTCGWKNFFIHSGATAANTGSTNSHILEHDYTCDVSGGVITSGQVSYPFFQAVAGPLAGSQGVVDNDPYHPTGLSAQTYRTYPLAADKWTRYWYHIELDKAGATFTDWATATGVTPTGTHNMLSIWIADEDRAKVRMLYKVPVTFNATDTAISALNISFDQSNNINNQEEKQTLDLTTMESGDTFTLTVPAYTNSRLSVTTSQETTGSVSFSADMRTAIETALEALDGVDDVIVSKLATQNYTIRFGGSPSGMVNIGQMTITPTGSGFAPVVATTQNGGTLTNLGTAGVSYFYIRNVMIFKNLTINEASAFFDQPEP